MKINKIILIGLAGFLLQGCATSVSQEKIYNAYYGEIPFNYEEQVQRSIGYKLIDPYSAHYEIYQPKKGYTKNSPLMGTKESFGWVVCGTVNSKNRIGGYVGRTPFFTLFKNNRIETTIVGGRSVVYNSMIETACNR